MHVQDECSGVSQHAERSCSVAWWHSCVYYSIFCWMSTGGTGCEEMLLINISGKVKKRFKNGSY